MKDYEDLSIGSTEKDEFKKDSINFDLYFYLKHIFKSCCKK